jgi:hypothetical protein
MKTTGMKKITILIAVTIIVGVAYAKKDHIQHMFHNETASASQETHKNDDYEEMLLLNNLFADAEGDYHLIATRRVVDFSDGAPALENTPYIIQKSAKSLYMRAGSMESLNTPAGCVNVNHDTKDIFLSPAREVVLPEIFSAKQLKNMLENEKYQFSKTTSEDTVKYTLLNENHAVCKEYSVVVRLASKKILEVYTRYADPVEPEDLSKQKEIIIYISDYGKGVTKPGLLDLERIIDTRGAKVKAAEQYKDYSIIQ